MLNRALVPWKGYFIFNFTALPQKLAMLWAHAQPLWRVVCRVFDEGALCTIACAKAMIKAINHGQTNIVANREIKPTC